MRLVTSNQGHPRPHRQTISRPGFSAPLARARRNPDAAASSSTPRTTAAAGGLPESSSRGPKIRCCLREGDYQLQRFVTFAEHPGGQEDGLDVLPPTGTAVSYDRAAAANVIARHGSWGLTRKVGPAGFSEVPAPRSGTGGSRRRGRAQLDTPTWPAPSSPTARRSVPDSRSAMTAPKATAPAAFYTWRCDRRSQRRATRLERFSSTSPIP